MKFIINVARPVNDCNGTKFIHYFKVEAEYGNIKRVYDDLCKAFPNHKIDVYEWNTVGHEIDMENCNF